MPAPRRPDRRTLSVGVAPRRLGTARRTPSCSPEARKQGSRRGSTPSQVWSTWKSSRTSPSLHRKNSSKTVEPEPSKPIVDAGPTLVADIQEPSVFEDFMENGASTELIGFDNDLWQSVPTSKLPARLTERPGSNSSTRPGTSLTSLSVSSRSRRAAGLESNSAWPTARPENRLQTPQQQHPGVGLGQMDMVRSHTPGSRPSINLTNNQMVLPRCRRPFTAASNECNIMLPEPRPWQNALTVIDTDAEVVEGVGHATAKSEPPKSSNRCSQRVLRGPARALLPPLPSSDATEFGNPKASHTTVPNPERRRATKNTTIVATMNEEQASASTMLFSRRSIGRADAESPVGGFTAEELWHGHRSQAMRPANTMEAVWHLQPEYHECTPQWTLAVK